MFRFMPELMVFMHGLRESCRSVFCAFLLLLMVLYFASVALAQLAKAEGDKEPIASTFNTVPGTLWFLLVATVLPDLWNAVSGVEH